VEAYRFPRSSSELNTMKRKEEERSLGRRLEPEAAWLAVLVLAHPLEATSITSRVVMGTDVFRCFAMAVLYFML
jgi:hypothetical protein